MLKTKYLYAVFDEDVSMLIYASSLMTLDNVIFEVLTTALLKI